MKSTGACRFTVACASSLRRGTGAFACLLLAVLLVSTGAAQQLLPQEKVAQQLSPQEKAARFKELDARAEAAMHAREFSRAIDLYSEAVRLMPDSARGHYGLGMAQAAAKDFLAARESLRTADRLQPTTGMPLLMQVRINFSLQDLDALKANLREAAVRFPQDAALHAALSRFLAENNLLLLSLAESLRSAGQDAPSTIQLAVLENTVGAFEDSASSALKVEQDHSLSNELRATAAGVAGLSYESLARSDEAIRYLREAIELDPTRSNSYLALADLFEQSQKYAEAVAVLEQARRNIPDLDAISLPLGTNLIRAERYKEGAGVLRELLLHAPDNNDAYIGLADAARKMGDAKQEVEALRDLARHNPRYPMVHVLIAKALLNDVPVSSDGVLAELSLAEQENPADPDIFYLRSKVFVTQGRYKEALAPLRRAIELRPLEPGPYYQLARVYQKLGEPEAAREQFERVKYLEKGP